ncbi:MAG: LytTR family transcriptional regulator DNA-binding domain-containing protein [Saprospiraceae bacterium]|nr:LytTR family transcriptional regulator DNA-binding domain-containing protein [Saprospiraceae bacterium]
MKESAFSFFLSNRYKYVISIALGVFLFLFMAVFLPFGVSNYNPRHQYTFEFFSVLSVFMLGTTGMALLNEFIVKPLLVRMVTLWRVVVWSLWLLIILGLTNFLIYNVLGEWHDFSFSSAIEFVFNCSTVFIFPMVGIFFYYRYGSLKSEYETLAGDMQLLSGDQKFLHFHGEGSNDQISISLNDFLFAQAQDNYVAVNYLSDKGVKRDLIRTSLSRVQENIGSDLIIRCHRSYIVNLYNLQSYKAARQPKIRLKFTEVPIPVSKSYEAQILNRLGKRDI